MRERKEVVDGYTFEWKIGSGLKNTHRAHGIKKAVTESGFVRLGAAPGEFLGLAFPTQIAWDTEEKRKRHFVTLRTYRQHG